MGLGFVSGAGSDSDLYLSDSIPSISDHEGVSAFRIEVEVVGSACVILKNNLICFIDNKL